MKQNNRQTLPLGRSTKKNNAGLSLLRPKLFTVVGDTYKYFNEVFHNILTICSDIPNRISFSIARLTQKKFLNCSLSLFPNQRYLIIKTKSTIKRAFFRPPFSQYKFSY
jgi:hypothetical protein